jgi:hypothetical protein
VHERDPDVQRAEDGDIQQDVGEIFVGNDRAVEAEDKRPFRENAECIAGCRAGRSVSHVLLLRYFKSRRRVGEREDNYSVFARIQLQSFAPIHSNRKPMKELYLPCADLIQSAFTILRPTRSRRPVRVEQLHCCVWPLPLTTRRRSLLTVIDTAPRANWKPSDSPCNTYFSSCPPRQPCQPSQSRVGESCHYY